MKKKNVVIALLVVAILAMVIAIPVMALQDTPPPVTEQNLILLGAVAAALTFGLRILATYANVKIGRVVMNVILFVISWIFAGSWAGLDFPSIPSDVGEVYNWLNACLLLITPILGTASLIYNILYNKVVMPLTAKLAKE